MAWASLPGSPTAYIGGGHHSISQQPILQGSALDAANEATIIVGYVMTSDGASHTIDTTGSSSIGWRSGAVTFANGTTVVKVGLAAVDTANGPPARAANAANVVTFDVNTSHTGGGGGITANAWQTGVPSAGTKTIANGDFVAFAIQMTARGGADSVILQTITAVYTQQGVVVTNYLGGTYTAGNSLPNILITFSDGATGWFVGTELASTITTRTFNSGSVTKEYGQLYQFPFPVQIYGLYGMVDPDNNLDAVLYSDPLGGSPVAEKTVAVDANTTASGTGRFFQILFPSPYFADAYEKVGAVLKPGASNISMYYKTLAAAGHRVALQGVGTTGYGISRATGAFADANSSLDHYYIGLIVGAFQHGVEPQSLIGI